MASTLCTYPENFRAYKVLIAAKFVGVKVTVASDFVFGHTNKSEAFLKKFPLEKVPAFETADGKYLTESNTDNTITHYVSNEQLRGRTDLEKAEVLPFLSLTYNELLSTLHAWVFPMIGMHARLVKQTFLVEERLTLADIVVFATLMSAYEHVLDSSFRAPFGSVTRWATMVLNQPQVKAVVKNFTLCLPNFRPRPELVSRRRQRRPSRSHLRRRKRYLNRLKKWIPPKWLWPRNPMLFGRG